MELEHFALMPHFYRSQLFLFLSSLFRVRRQLILSYAIWKRRTFHVTDTTARIIDFSAYRSRRRASRVDRSLSGSNGAFYHFATTGPAAPVLWYWPVYVWVPVFMPVASAAE
jgi:hypothetical protein